MIRKLLGARRRRTEAALLPYKRAILGEQVMVGVDVGSAAGMQPHWRAYEGVVDLYLVEPHDDSRAALIAAMAGHPHADMLHVLPAALSANGGERTLHMLNAPTGSSLHEINFESEYVSPADRYIFPLRELRLQTRRLNDVLDEQGVRDVDIMKLDVQGAELEVLQGLDDRRRKQLLLVEVEINVSGGVARNLSIYKEAPSWEQIDQLLLGDGMRLLDFSVARAYRGVGGDDDWYQRQVFRVYRNSTSLAAHAWEVDAVYVRDWRALITRRDSGALRKLALALCGYRFFGEAYFIVERAEEAKVLASTDVEALKASIVTWHRAYRQWWQARGAFWTWMRHMLSATGVSQLRRWKQYMWVDYPNG